MSRGHPNKPWTIRELTEMIQKMEAGATFPQLCKEYGRSRNSLVSAWSNYVIKKVWDWSLIKKITKGEDHGTQIGS